MTYKKQKAYDYIVKDHTSKAQYSRKVLNQSLQNSSKTKNLVDIWKEELKSLQVRKYIDSQAALTAVVDTVLFKLYGQEQDQELKDFLYFYLENDPEVMSQVEKILLKS